MGWYTFHQMFTKEEKTTLGRPRTEGVGVLTTQTPKNAVVGTGTNRKWQFWIKSVLKNTTFDHFGFGGDS